MNYDFAKWFCQDMVPFSTVNKPGFRYFFGKNMKTLTIPDESTLRKTALIDVLEETRVKVQQDLMDVKSINLMLDGWTDKHHRYPYLKCRLEVDSFVELPSF